METKLNSRKSLLGRMLTFILDIDWNPL